MSNTIKRDKKGRILTGSKGLNLSKSKGSLIYKDGKKLCSRCKLWKSKELFYKRNSTALGVESNCKDCSVIRKGLMMKSIKYSSYKRGAKARGLSFDLTKEEFGEFWEVPCSYCDELIETIGLDRIDNNVGYIKSNVTSCCTLCNTMKRALPKDVFITHCQKIARISNKHT